MTDLIARRVQALKPSTTLAIDALAKQLKAEGKDVISLALGEPDFETPENVKAKAIEAIQQNKTKYTSVAGTETLKQAIVDKFQRENHLSYTKNEVMVSTGAKQALFNAFLATLNPEDEVIIPAPYWVSYPTMVDIAGGKNVILPTKEEHNFCVMPDELEAALTPHTKWLLLNSPSNPLGSCYGKAELEALGQVLLRHPTVYVLSDDIYEHISYDGAKFYTLAEVVPELKARVLIVNGISKAYAMTGWRIGYAAGPVELIKAMTKLQSASTSNPCSISQEAAVEALNGTQEFIPERQAIFQKRRDLVVKMLNAIPGIHCRVPTGAFYAFPSIASLKGKRTPSGVLLQDSYAIATHILEDALVAVVPGGAFGMDDYMRLSYATSEELLVESLRRIQEFCLSLSA